MLDIAHQTRAVFILIPWVYDFYKSLLTVRQCRVWSLEVEGIFPFESKMKYNVMVKLKETTH